MRLLGLCSFIVLGFSALGQQLPDNWQHLSPVEGQEGMASVEAYDFLKSKTPGRSVVVAVLDSGVDIEHEDLKEKLWVNPGEIAGNGIDDDNNGYIDDLHGWSFLSGADGDVHHATLEFTRIYRELHRRFSGIPAKDVAPIDSEDFARYKELKQQYQERVEKERTEARQFRQVDQFYAVAKQTFESRFPDGYTLEDIQNLRTKNDFEANMRDFMVEAINNDYEKQFESMRKHYVNVFDYAYNLEFDDRAIIGDDPTNYADRNYGTPRVAGPDPLHGTHVAGIIAAQRGNDIGMDGVAEHAEIMVLRVVPDGDEYDKDVANAIRYAADNGANIINMSFGKSYSPGEAAVEEAIAYAEAKGVLLVHAAGNSNRSNDRSPNFPNDKLENGFCSTWIEVGASGGEADRSLPASFSNYGCESVDIFAPGVAVYACLPNNDYGRNQGTSMAAPMVAGAAAVIMAYFPDLTAQQVRQVLLDSVRKHRRLKVNIPGKGKTTRFKKLSVTGGVLDLDAAVRLAAKRSNYAS